jgi:hypothetical protein
MKKSLITLSYELVLPVISCTSMYGTTCRLLVRFRKIFTVRFRENSVRQAGRHSEGNTRRVRKVKIHHV